MQNLADELPWAHMSDSRTSLGIPTSCLKNKLAMNDLLPQRISL